MNKSHQEKNCTKEMGNFFTTLLLNLSKVVIVPLTFLVVTKSNKKIVRNHYSTPKKSAKTKEIHLRGGIELVIPSDIFCCCVGFIEQFLRRTNFVCESKLFLLKFVNCLTDWEICIMFNYSYVCMHQFCCLKPKCITMFSFGYMIIISLLSLFIKISGFKFLKALKKDLA